MKIIVHNVSCAICSLVLATTASAGIIPPTNENDFFAYSSLIDIMKPSQSCKSRPQAVASTVRPAFSQFNNLRLIAVAETGVFNDVWHPSSNGDVSSTVKLAAVRFITDGSAYVKFDRQVFDVADLCADMNYKVAASSCGEGMVAGKVCAYSSEYVEACYEPTEWCLKYGYAKTVSSCASNEKPANPCPHNPEYYRSCENASNEICEAKGYYQACEEGKIPDETQAGCPEDSSYKKCVCNPCTGFNYTAEEASAAGYVPEDVVCNSCGTIKYKRRPADCGEFVECDCGGVGETCWSGSRKLFESCKDCNMPCEEGAVNINTYWCRRALKCWIKS